MSPEAGGVGHRPTDIYGTTFRASFICFHPFVITLIGGSGAKPLEADGILLFKTSHFTPFLTSLYRF